MKAWFDPRFRYRQVETNGITLHAVECGKGPAVVFLHGIPTCWYTFRKQLPAVAEAGYRAIAVDLRGFGRSSCPMEVSAYDALDFVGDWCGLLDDIGAEQAVFVGHDEGAHYVWEMAQLHPERTAGICAIAIPLIRLPEPITEINRKRFTDGRFMHVLFNQEYGPAEDFFEADVRGNLRRMFIGLDQGSTYPRREWEDAGVHRNNHDVDPDAPLPSWLSEEEFEYFVLQYKVSGYRGAINHYRNFDRTWEMLQPYRDSVVDLPVMYMAGERDQIIYPRRTRAFVDEMDRWVPQLRRREIVPGAGFFLHEEMPDYFNGALIEFLDGIDYAAAEKNWRPSPKSVNAASG